MMAVKTAASSHGGSDLSSSSTQPKPSHEDVDRIRRGPNSIARPFQLTRRISKGTIAGYTDSPFNNTSPNSSFDPNLSNSKRNPSLSRNASGKRNSRLNNNIPVPTSKEQKLSTLKNTAIKSASRSSCSAQLALVCINATAKFGPRLKLSLCPKKMRTRIFKEIREKKGKTKRSHSRTQQHEDGDEDEMIFLDKLQEEDESSGDEEDEDDTIENVDDPPGESGKLAFGRRKIAFFDRVTAQERERARSWLKRESESSKKRDRETLDRYLKNMQQLQAKNQRGLNGYRMTSGIPTTEEEFDLLLKGERNERSSQSMHDTNLPSDLTISLNAAFILESLSFTPLESLEGMSKCYDGLVSAGTVLLEEDEQNRSLSKKKDFKDDNKGFKGSKNGKNKILTALATILITNLDYTSGETILALSRLRAICGTSRYKRRFTQRIAPLLIRPPNSAIWCLKHQTDMRAIASVCELLFDCADDVFYHGWFEKGRNLLADSRRAESLNAAARQLRALSTNAESRSRRQSLLFPLSKAAESGNEASGKQNLAEWEVLAVDLQIRDSIKSVFSKEWKKIRGAPRQSSTGASADSSLKQRREARGSMSPRHSHSSHSLGDLIQPNSSPRLQFSPLTQPHMHSPTKSPKSGPNTTQRFSHQRDQNSFSQSQNSKQHKHNPQQRSNKKLSPPDHIDPSNQEIQSVPMTPKPLSIQSTFSTTPTTPPLSPKSPKSTKSSSSSVAYDRLLSTAPQLPIIPSINNSNTLSLNNETRHQSQPAPPLSPTPSSTSQHSQRAYHPTTLSTMFGSNRAAERKRTLAACRALRAQITRFEESFISLHGRPPKGAAERAPLATTYAQYREWKRVIRADAACRIQALFRGFILRIHVLSRVGRDDFFSRWRAVIIRVRKRNTFPPQLTIPVEIDEDGVRGENSSGSFGIDEDRGDGVEVMISPRSEQQKQFSHSSRSSTSSRRNGSSALRTESRRGSRLSTPSHQHQPNQNSSNNTQTIEKLLTPDLRPMNTVPSTNATSSRGSEQGHSSTRSIENMSVSELHAEKRSLKNLLKQYDMEFHRKHKRMPVKIEKEPIRHLYEKYNSLKSRIQMLNSSDNNNDNTPSTAMNTSSGGMRHSRTSSSNYSSSSDINQEELSDLSTSGSGRHRGRGISLSNSSATSSLSSGAPSGTSTSDRLEALKGEKARLHQMLRSYERDFFREYQRQVSSFSDIRPVASQYRRYKEIKKSIAALQGSNISSR